MQISFELIARDEEAVARQLAFVQSELPFVDIINIPDLLRFSIRSWEAGKLLPRDRYRFVPHFRAIDFDIRSDRLFDIIAEYDLQEVLLVTGDPPPDMSFRIYDTRVTELIRRVRERCPGVKVYGGFDPYRSSVRDEVEYMEDKFAAGADALFSQPFFDMRLMSLYGDYISGRKVFWGISPVVSEHSRRYWETMNNAVFPADFRPDYDWNTAFTREALSFARASDANVYFMPIKIDLARYFQGIRDLFD